MTRRPTKATKATKRDDMRITRGTYDRRHPNDEPAGRPVGGGFLSFLIRKPSARSTVPEFWFTLCAIIWFSDLRIWNLPEYRSEQSFTRGALIEFAVFALVFLVWAIVRAVRKWQDVQSWRLLATIAYALVICVAMASANVDWMYLVVCALYVVYAVLIGFSLRWKRRIDRRNAEAVARSAKD